MAEKLHQLLILGNGFDLHCKLHSSYDDFFKWRVRELFDLADESQSIRQYFNQARRIISEDSRSFKEGNVSLYELKKSSPRYADLTFWDVVFLFAENEDLDTQDWQDIEDIIYRVVVSILDRDGIGKTHSHFQKMICNFFDINYQGNANQYQKAAWLLKELEVFENVFSNYLYFHELHLDRRNYYDSEYFKLATETLKSITGFYDKTDYEREVDVLSFNYTIGPRFKKLFNYKLGNRGSVKINSWNNIHGLVSHNDVVAKQAIKSTDGKQVDALPAPVFGIDSHDAAKSSEKSIMLFTKTYRILSNEFLDIRENFNLENVDLITVYGHSLNMADYTYFSTIFNDTDLEHGKVKLEFYYYPGEIEEDISSNSYLAKMLEGKQDYSRKVINLLSKYRKEEGCTTNLTAKLILEGRISLRPMKDE